MNWLESAASLAFLTKQALPRRQPFLTAIGSTRLPDLPNGTSPLSIAQEALSSLWMAKAILQQVLFAALVLVSILRGAAPERVCAGILLGMDVIDMIYHAWFGAGARFYTIDIGHSVIDMAAFLALACTALVANRVYPIWLASLQLIAALAHLVRDLSPAIAGSAYAILIILPSYLEILVLTGGLINHVRRTRHYGPYRSWLNFSPTSAKVGLRKPPND